MIITGDSKLLLTNFLFFFFYSVGFVRFACFEFRFSSRDGICGS